MLEWLKNRLRKRADGQVKQVMGEALAPRPSSRDRSYDPFSVVPPPPRFWREQGATETEQALREVALEMDLNDNDVVHLHALHGVLRRLAQSPARGRYVLRGSLLLHAWVSERSTAVLRQPRDIDLVWIGSGDPMAYNGAEAARSAIKSIVTTPVDDGVTFDAEKVEPVETWPYSESPGQRYLLPWTIGQWRGEAQLDVSLDEVIDPPAVDAQVPGLLPAMSATVLAATPELALTWKLRWLLDDDVAQPKDLWDALLLIRHLPMDRVLFERALDTAHPALPPGREAYAPQRLRDRLVKPSDEELADELGGKVLYSHWSAFAPVTQGAPRQAEEAGVELVTRLRDLLPQSARRD